MVGDAASVAADAAATAAAMAACGAALGGRGSGFSGRGGSSGGRGMLGGRLGAPSASPPPVARLTRSPSGEEMGGSEREMPPLFSNGTPGVPDLPLGVGSLCDQGPYGVVGLLGGVGVGGDGDAVGVGVGGRGSVGLPDVELDAVFDSASGRMGGGVGAVSLPPPSSVGGVGVGAVGGSGYAPIGAGLGGDPTGGDAAMAGDPSGGASIESEAVGGANEDDGVGDVAADVPDVTPVERVVRLGDGSFVY